jgi:hypothetical protein
MLVRWPLALACVSLIFAVAAPAARANGCVVSQGDRIVLSGQRLDPDVFVWDSAPLLTSYLEGDFTTEIVLKHTMLAHPGTKAIAVSCKEAAARPQYSKESMDLVGVKLVDGPNRGRYGWVVADDIRRPDGRPVTPPTP